MTLDHLARELTELQRLARSIPKLPDIGSVVNALSPKIRRQLRHLTDLSTDFPRDPLEAVRRQNDAMAAAVSHTANSVQAFFKDSEREATELEPFVVKLGKAGWTIPLEWVPRAYQRFVDNIPDDQFDKAFVAYYSADGRKEAKAMFARLLAAPGLARWRRPLGQAIWAFERRKYHITGTALLPILEGAVARAAKQTSTRTRSTRRMRTRRLATPAS
jgi:hypothetical protein